MFRDHGSQRHGAGAAGVRARGDPDLLDDDWLSGGRIARVADTARHGIRNEEDPDARWSQMPPFEGILSDGEIAATASHVRSLSGLGHDAGLAEEGGALFAQNCTSCHGEDGRGDREIGAPNLSDAIWLRGGTQEAIERLTLAPRHGVMTPWGDRLGEAQMRAVAAHVHGPGGGERAVAEAPPDPAEAARVPAASRPAAAEETPAEAGEPPVEPAPAD